MTFFMPAKHVTETANFEIGNVGAAQLILTQTFVLFGKLI
jgi:hypothetical protein